LTVPPLPSEIRSANALTVAPAAMLSVLPAAMVSMPEAPCVSDEPAPVTVTEAAFGSAYEPVMRTSPPFCTDIVLLAAELMRLCGSPDGGPPWNERGQWLIKEKERRGAETVDVEWLANYKPSKPDVTKPAEQAPKEERKASGKVDPKSFDDFVGEYEAPIGVLTITHEGDKLFGQPKGESKEELIPQEDGSFQVTNVEAKVVFNRDASGKVVEVVISLGGQEMKGKKIK